MDNEIGTRRMDARQDPTELADISVEINIYFPKKL